MVKETSQKPPGPAQPLGHPGWVDGWVGDGQGTPHGTAGAGTTEETTAGRGGSERPACQRMATQISISRFVSFQAGLWSGGLGARVPVKTRLSRHF